MGRTMVVVSARKEKANFIIGVDFFAANDGDLSLQQKLFTLGEHKVECSPEWVRVSHSRVESPTVSS